MIFLIVLYNLLFSVAIEKEVVSHQLTQFFNRICRNIVAVRLINKLILQRREGKYDPSALLEDFFVKYFVITLSD